MTEQIGNDDRISDMLVVTLVTEEAAENAVMILLVTTVRGLVFFKLGLQLSLDNIYSSKHINCCFFGRYLAVREVQYNLALIAVGFRLSFFEIN